MPLLALLPAVGLQAELNPALVPADAKWVLHADVAALRSTVLGEKLMAQVSQVALTPETDPLRPNVPKILETVGLITAFGSDLSGKPEAIDGALVLQGTADLRKIAEGMMAQMTLSDPENVTEVSDLPFEAYSMSGEVFIGFPEEPIVLVSKSQPQLMKALEVFRGRAPSLAGTSSPLLALLPKGGRYYLMGASAVPSAQALTQGGGPQARILQMAESGSFAVGEDGEKAIARVQLVANSSDIAVKLAKIVEGMTAMLSLAETSDARVSEFVNSLKVERNQSAVTLAFSYPTERVLELLQRPEPPPPSAKGGAEPLAAEGTVLAEWTADATLGGDAPRAGNFTERVVDNVALLPGATIVLTGRRHQGEHARWDYIELTPVGGAAGAPQRFEAEYMRLEGYSIERQDEASGGEIIKADGRGSARLRFTGTAGTYRLVARYVDENDGRAPMAISVLPPASP